MSKNLTHLSHITLILLVLALCSVSVHALLPAENRDGMPTLAPVMKMVTPAVVNIQTRTVEETPMMRDPFFRRFFNAPNRPPREQRSAGSGVIIDAKKGYILTNHHVINGANEISVTLKDRRTFKAKLIGSDAGTDIGLLQIEAKALHALSFGDSDILEVGDLRYRHW